MLMILNLKNLEENQVKNLRKNFWNFSSWFFEKKNKKQPNLRNKTNYLFTEDVQPQISSMKSNINSMKDRKKKLIKKENLLLFKLF